MRGVFFCHFKHKRNNKSSWCSTFFFVSISALRDEEMVKFMSSYRTSVAATGRPFKWISANATTSVRADGRESFREPTRPPGCSIESLFFPFLWFVYFFTDRLAHRAVVMMSAGIDLRGWQQDIHADSRDQVEAVEHGISFIFGKGPRLLKKWERLC